MSNILLVVIFTLIMLPGIAGILLPVFPGIPIMLVIALIYGFIDRFVHLTVANLLVLAGIAALSLVVDYLSGILGAKYSGASRRSIYFGAIGLILGIFLIPPFGGIIGLFAGVLLSELYQHGDRKRAIKAAGGSALGSLTGIGINLVLAIIFIVLFLIFAIR